MKEKFVKRLFNSKIFLIINLIILVLLSVGLGKRIIEQRGVRQEIAALEKEIENLENKNRELSELLKYLNTDSFLEEEARLKLSLQKPGESVVIIPEKDLLNKTQVENFKNETDRKDTNLHKWWNYFFRKQN
jgi:cell division protein FtsB